MRIEEGLLNTMFKDSPKTRIQVRQIIDDIYECNDQDNIIYLTLDQLEAIEEEDNKTYLEDEVCYENI